MSAEPEVKQVARKRSARKWRVLLAAFLLCGLGGSFLVYKHFTAGERIRGMAQDYLQRFTQGSVSIGRAKTSWYGGVQLFDVLVTETAEGAAGDGKRTAASRSYPVFSCREITLTHDFTAAVLGKLRILSVVALEPTCAIVRDVPSGRVSVAGISQLPDWTGGGSPPALPRIELRDAHIQFVSQEERQAHIVEEIQLTLRGLPSKQDPAVYDVVWYKNGGQKTNTGQSQIDLGTGRIWGKRNGLPPISAQATMLALSSKYSAAASWGEILGLTGFVRAMDYDFSSEGLRFGMVVLANASVSIPVSDEERHVPPESRYLQIEHVYGQVNLTDQETSAAFIGKFHGSECTADINFHGDIGKVAAFADLDFDARVAVKNLTLPRADADATPAEARLINHWPKLAEIYADYDPRGPADIEVEVSKRSGADEPVVIRRAAVTATGGEAMFRQLPYRVGNLTGTVEYTPEAIFVRHVRGERGGGAVSVDGRIATGTQPGASELTVSGSEIPMDYLVWNALPERYREYRKRFAPEGTVDFETVLARAARQSERSEPWHWVTTITLPGISANYAGFPYPLSDLRGKLVLDEHAMREIDTVGRAGKARVGISGMVAFADGQVEDLDLVIQGEDVEVDDQVLSALPDHLRSWIQPFHPRGRVNVQTSLKLDPDTGRTAHSSTVTLNECSIQHAELPVEVRGILGNVHVTPRQAVFEGLTGLYNGTVVSADGTVALADARPAAQFVIRAKGIQLDDRLMTALPEQVHRAVSEWKVDGPADVETLLTIDPSGDNPSVVAQTFVQLSGVTAGHHYFPIPFHDVHGRISVDGTAVQTEGIQARYGDATIRADVTARFGEGKESGALTLSVANLALGDNVRGCLHGRLATTWDRLQPRGSVDLRLDSIRYERVAPGARREWSVDGSVQLRNVALPGLSGIEGVSGTISGQGMLVDRADGAWLDGDLALSTITVLGEHLTRIQAAWSCAKASGGGGVIALESLSGLIYEGDLSAEAKLLFDTEKAGYELSANVRGMRIGPFLNATRATHLPGSEMREVEGLADAHLHLSGPVGDPSSRRGAGRFEFTEARIQRLPIILAILAVLNLSIPDQNAFDTVSAEFLVAGNRVYVNDVELRGTGLALSGSGSVSLPDWGVDLNLINVTPHRWARVPVLTDLVEGAAGELVELNVSGPLSQPTVRAVPLRAVRDELNQLFKKKRPKPIPPARP